MERTYESYAARAEAIIKNFQDKVKEAQETGCEMMLDWRFTPEGKNENLKGVKADLQEKADNLTKLFRENARKFCNEYKVTLPNDGKSHTEDVANALKVIDFLVNHPKVAAVNHPSLPDHPDHTIYQRYFPDGAGSIFTFEVKGGTEEAQKFIDSLQIFSLLANVADVKSLVIHPATTTHSQLNAQELAEQGIKPGTVRLSIGTEHIEDIIDDLRQALEKI